MNMKNYKLTRRVSPRIILGTLCVIWGMLSSQDTFASSSFIAQVSFYEGVSITHDMTEFDPSVLTVVVGDGDEIVDIATPPLDPLFEFSEFVELYFGYHTNAALPITVFTHTMTQIGVLHHANLQSISEHGLLGVDWQHVSTPLAVNHDDILLLQTGAQSYVALGNIQKCSWDTTQLTFEYLVVDGTSLDVPEPATYGFIVIGLCFLGGIAIFRHRKSLRVPYCRTSTSRIIFLGALIFLTSVSHMTMAATLKVIRVGTGDGLVEGEKIFCGPFCQKSYEEGTVIHLKATTFNDESVFRGWTVNGRPHEGVIRLEAEDMIVAARFDAVGWTPDELTMMWYEGNSKVWGTLVLDEVDVTYEPLNSWDVSTEAEARAAIQEIARLFHPQATMKKMGHISISFSSPIPLAREQLPQVLAALEAHPYVKEASPIIYNHPSQRTGRMVPKKRMWIRFPLHLTDEERQTIETRYGLLYVKHLFEKNDQDLIYTVQEGDVLDLIQRANELYESGFVEEASPIIGHEFELRSMPDDTFFPKQWHLSNTGQYNGTPGEDLHVTEVWDTYRGSSEEVIAIVDDAISLAHEDLQDNVLEDALHWDYADSDSVPQPLPPSFWESFLLNNAEHGTRVAGVATARGFNELGVCGCSQCRISWSPHNLN